MGKEEVGAEEDGEADLPATTAFSSRRRFILNARDHLLLEVTGKQIESATSIGSTGVEAAFAISNAAAALANKTLSREAPPPPEAG